MTVADELAATRDLLRLRSQALSRTTEQLTAVRARHAGVPMTSVLGDRWCDTCKAVWPCETAQAAGMTATPTAVVLNEGVIRP